jgi:hypothetical protein
MFVSVGFYCHWKSLVKHLLGKACRKLTLVVMSAFTCIASSSACVLVVTNAPYFPCGNLPFVPCWFRCA